VITLAIETSTTHGSVALCEDGRTIFFERFAADRALGTHLFPCLQRAGEAAPRYDRIAVGLGPGSYSGVRIAIAAAIGLELSRGAKVLGIPSILALETNAEKYLTIGDARRASFYFALIENGGCTTGPMLLDETQLKAALASHPALPVFAAEPVEGIPHLEICFPSAERLALLAEQCRGIIARDNLEPIYLRDPHITQAKKIREISS
jgi:tRNA threonylcarbamoyladenosine biosynthesis protein TsaB